MKPEYQNVWGLKIIDQGYRGVYRFLGNPLKKIANPGRVWGIPYLNDVAIIDIKPKSKKIKINVVSKDKQNFDIEPTLYNWVNDPMGFMDSAPVDYNEQLIDILKHEVEGQVSRNYSIEQLMEARTELAGNISQTINQYLLDRRWGLSTDVFIPDIEYPSLSTNDIDIKKIKIDKSLPLDIKIKEFELKLIELEAKKFAISQEQLAEGYKVLITTVMDAKAAGYKRLATAIQEVGESILEPYADKLEPAYVAWISKGIIKEVLGGNNINSEISGIDEEVERIIKEGLSGEALRQKAEKAGISPTLAAILGTVEEVAPGITEKYTSPEELDEMLRKKYKQE